MRLFYIFLLPCFLVGCGPSQKEVELQSQLDELKEKQSKIEIDGSVFIKTKGGESIKLSLIPIGVSTLDKYEQVRLSVLNEKNAEVEKKSILMNDYKSKQLELYKEYIKTIEESREEEGGNVSYRSLNEGLKAARDEAGDPLSYSFSLNVITVDSDRGGSIETANELSKKHNAQIDEANKFSTRAIRLF